MYVYQSIACLASFTLLVCCFASATTPSVVVCNDKHLCSSNTTEHHCDCDINCNIHGTCCEDVYDPNFQTELKVVCMDAQLIVSCPSNNTSGELISKCLAPEVTSSEPGIDQWRVTSMASNLSYTNVFCALCNNEAKSDLLYWDLALKCFKRGRCLYNWQPPSMASICNDWLITDCEYGDPTTLNATSRDLCLSSAAAYVQTEDGEWFKNRYCVDCNDYPESDISACKEACYYCTGNIIKPDLQLLVRPSKESCVTEIGEEISDLTPFPYSCDRIMMQHLNCEGILAVAGTCESTDCPQEKVWQNGQCVPASGNNGSSIEQYCNQTDIIANRQTFSNAFKLDHTSYIYLTDGIALISNSTVLCHPCNLVSVPAEIVTEINSTLIIEGRRSNYRRPFFKTVNEVYLLCDAKTRVAPVSCDWIDDVNLLNYIFISVSIACLLVAIVIYSILPTFRNVPGLLLVSQMVCYLLAYSFFLARIGMTPGTIGCYVVATITYYFFVAAYLWSLLLAVEMNHTFSALYAVRQTSRKKALRYSAVGWLVPLVLVLLAVVIDHTDINPNLKPHLSGEQCWFSSNTGLRYYFMIPLAIIFTSNLTAYLAIVIRFGIHAYRTRTMKTRTGEKLILSIKLIFTFGLLWLVGILASIFPANQLLLCIFLFVSGLNGVWLFLSLICTRAVCQAIKQSRREKEATKHHKKVSISMSGTALTSASTSNNN